MAKSFALMVLGCIALVCGLGFTAHQMEEHTMNYSDVNHASVIYGEDGRVDYYEINYKDRFNCNNFARVNRRTYVALTNGSLKGKKFTLQHSLLNVSCYDYTLDQSRTETTKLN